MHKVMVLATDSLNLVTKNIIRLYFVISSIFAKIKASIHFWIHVDIAVFYIAINKVTIARKLVGFSGT